MGGVKELFDCDIMTSSDLSHPQTFSSPAVPHPHTPAPPHPAPLRLFLDQPGDQGPLLDLSHGHPLLRSDTDGGEGGIRRHPGHERLVRNRRGQCRSSYTMVGIDGAGGTGEGGVALR